MFQDLSQHVLVHRAYCSVTHSYSSRKATGIEGTYTTFFGNLKCHMWGKAGAMELGYGLATE